MHPRRLRSFCLLAAFLVFSFGRPSFAAQAASDTPKPKIDKASAYYYYSLGHLYADIAGAYGNRSDYFTKAIENFRLALKADPTATFLSEELSDLYIQAGRLREAVTEAEDILKQSPGDLNARLILARIYTRLIGDSQQNKFDENMLKKAIEQYQAIAHGDPKDADTWLMLGRLEKIAQNSPEAEKAYKKVLELDADNEDALTGLAMVYSDLGDTKQAGDLLRRAAEKSPSLRSLTTLAGNYEQMRDYALAAETFKRALALKPDNPDVKRAYALNLLLSDQLADSLKTYQELVSDEPKDVQSQLRISQIFRQQRKFDKAREASQKAKDLEPNNLEIRYNDVSLLEAEGKLPEAIASLNEIIASSAKKGGSNADKGSRVALVERLGLLYRSNEQYLEAVENFKRMAELDPDLAPRASAQIIDTWRLAKEFTKAQQEADVAAKKYPNDRLLISVRASLFGDLGKGDEAVALLKKTLDGKNDRETYLSIAQIYEKTRNFDEMEKAVETAAKLSLTKDEQEGVAFVRGAMYEKMKKYDLAEEEFRKVLAINPTNAATLNYLGYMFADRNERVQEAYELIGKALEQEPNNGAYLDSLGWVYFRMNKLHDAEVSLKRSLEKISRDPAVHDHLGDVYFHQGRLKEAIAQWDASLKEWNASAPSDRETDEIAKVQKKLEGAKVRLAKEGTPNAGKQQ